jgi:beta-mannosidase
MFDLLGNHPSIIAWACHNEPTMRLARRANLEQHPDPALYADAIAQDPTRAAFLCSGHLESDWQRAGDSHTYYGAIWSRRYTDIYSQHLKLNTEFGFEAPASRSTLRIYAEVWARLRHLEGQIDELWAYQAELIKYHVEHLRRLRATCSAGYIHFWMVDLVPQVGCGVIDSERCLKSGYEALRLASQPLHIALEHNGRRPIAIWVFNDLCQPHPGAIVHWQVFDEQDRLLLEGRVTVDVAANCSQRVMSAAWKLPRGQVARVMLRLEDQAARLLASNYYERPFQARERPAGYPWKFDPFLGIKVFDAPDAPSLADVGTPTALRRVPLRLREVLTEHILRQQVPVWLASSIARVLDRF